MEYDLAIIGSGFAGLMAAKKAQEKNLNFCVVAEHSGATQHFSGAFDVIDPRWQETALHPENYPSLEKAFSDFIKAHPYHLYALLSSPALEKNLVFDEMRAFFEFYQIPVLGDGRQMVAAFGSLGQVKPAGFTLSSQGLLSNEIKRSAKVLYVNFPDLSDYPATLIRSHVEKFFSNVEILECPIFSLNRMSAFAHLLQLLDQESSQNRFVDFIKNHKADLIFVPPVLGIKKFHHFHQKLESVLHARVVELLSVLPSSAGLRMQEFIKKFFDSSKIPVFKARVMGAEQGQNSIQKISVCDSLGKITEIGAKNFILATGKYLGGGIECQKNFKEKIFDLPLYAHGKKISSEISVSQLIQQDALARQSFMEVGVSFKTPYKNLVACGHVLAGFDFGRDRCGFGVSVISALKALKTL